jgi:hypothetical protein
MAIDEFCRSIRDGFGHLDNERLRPQSVETASRSAALVPIETVVPNRRGKRCTGFYICEPRTHRRIRRLP